MTPAIFFLNTAAGCSKVVPSPFFELLRFLFRHCSTFSWNSLELRELREHPCSSFVPNSLPDFWKEHGVCSMHTCSVPKAKGTQIHSLLPPHEQTSRSSCLYLCKIQAEEMVI